MNTKKSKLVYVIGIIVILLGAGLLIYWNGLGGRQAMTYSGVVVAKVPILKGATITEEMIGLRQIEEESIMSGALTADQAAVAVGSVAKVDIPFNAQISTNYFYDNDLYLEEQQSIFALDETWISEMSDSLRRGDYVSIYGADGNTYLGSYRIAFNNVEQIEGIGSQEYADPIDRNTTPENEDEVEIVAKLPQYAAIYAYVHTASKDQPMLKYNDWGESQVVSYDERMMVDNKIIIMQVKDFDEAAAIEADRIARIQAAQQAAEQAEAQAPEEEAVPAE